MEERYNLASVESDKLGLVVLQICRINLKDNFQLFLTLQKLGGTLQPGVGDPEQLGGRFPEHPGRATLPQQHRVPILRTAGGRNS